MTAARSSSGRTLRGFQTDLYGLWWQFCEYLGCQWILSFSESFSLCHEFIMILQFKGRYLNPRLGGRGIYASEVYFSNFWKIKKEKDWSDHQPDSMIQPRARGLLYMEREYFAHHIWSRFQGLSTSQTRSNRKYLENYSTNLNEGPEATRRRFRLPKVLEDALPSTWRLQDSATKSSGACQTRGSGTAYRHRMF